MYREKILARRKNQKYNEHSGKVSAVMKYYKIWYSKYVLSTFANYIFNYL